MDKDTLTGLLLIGLLFMTYTFMVTPPEEALKNNGIDSTQVQVNRPLPTDEENNSPTTATTNTTTTVLDGIFKQSSKQEVFKTIENDLLKVTVSNKGARPYKIELKNYVTYDSLALVLLDGQQNQLDYILPINRNNIHTQDYYFDINSSNENSISMRLYLADTSNANPPYIEQTYALEAGDYMMDYNFKMVGFEQLLRYNTPIVLKWESYMRKQEQDMESERYVTSVYYREKDDSPTYLSETSDDTENINLSLDWVSFKQQFFNTTLIADKSFQRGDLSIKTPSNDNGTVLEIASADMGFEYHPSPEYNFPMKMYMGPNAYETLKKYDQEMEALVPLGWGIFGWVNKWFIIPIFNFLSQFISSYGIIILILTIFIKLLLSPLTLRSYTSFAKMNLLKPELDELREKYGKDAQKMQAEQMKLYSQAGVNPLGGCLPQLVQFPILIAMYRFFPSSIELRQESFLWAEDLSTYDNILDLPFTIPFYGDHVSLFCLLSAASSLIYMRLNQQMTPSTGGNNEFAKQMQLFQYIMPVMLLFIFNSFSAALCYYFFLSNIFSFGQQWAIKNYFIDEDKLHAQIQDNKKKPSKKSSWQQRLEATLKEQQKKQQEVLKQKKGNNDNTSENNTDSTKKSSNYTPPKNRRPRK